MNKRKYHVLILLLLIISAFVTYSAASVIVAQSSFAIASTGTIECIALNPTTTPSPITAASGSNLAVMPNQWFIGTPWGDGNNFIVKDTSVEHTAGNPSIRIDQDYWHNDRADYLTTWTIPCKAGDHIFFSCWIKTGNAHADNNNPNFGFGRIGIDLYVTSGGTWHGLVWQNGYPSNGGAVTYGNNWTYVYFDVTVPSTWTGLCWVDQTYYTGPPISIAPWIQAYPYTGAPSVWFADAQLTIS